jgi:hypothetical protein
MRERLSSHAAVEESVPLNIMDYPKASSCGRRLDE